MEHRRPGFGGDPVTELSDRGAALRDRWSAEQREAVMGWLARGAAGDPPCGTYEGRWDLRGFVARRAFDSVELHLVDFSYAALVTPEAQRIPQWDGSSADGLIDARATDCVFHRCAFSYQLSTTTRTWQGGFVRFEFERCDFGGAILNGCTMAFANFHQCDFRQASVHDARTFMTE
ncbi:MAG: pentapeptide repeat-containing protein, partial [Phycisphaerales bacterium JB060]